MKTEVVVITPAYAEEILSRNTNNRNIRPKHVDAISKDMRDGNWHLTHQGIAISPAGILLDGQHRLLAVIKSGVSVKMPVSRDVPEDAFKAIDSGVGRTLKDRFGGNSRTIEVVRMAAEIMGGKVTPDIYERYASSRLYAVSDELIAHTGATRKNYTPAGMRLAACLRVLDGADRNFVFGQYRAMVLAEFDDMSSLVKSYVKRVDTRHLVMPSGGYHQRILMAYGLKLFDRSVSGNVLFRMPQSEIESHLTYAKSVLKYIAE